VLTPIVLSILVFGAFALAFDGVWSVVALRTRSRYGVLAWVNFLIYFTAGFVGGSGAHGLTNGLMAGMLAGGAVSAIDSTLGWWLSALVGPGRPVPRQSTVKIVLVAVVVVIYGALSGAIGGMLSELV
jgi:hypothetical protein